MKGWKLLNTYDRLHQAEIRKDVLEKNDIKAVIVNEKDSAFLMGDIELWVEESSFEKSKIFLGEFEGWIKIGSFFNRQQIERLEERVKTDEIDTRILRRDSPSSILPEYELYVERENQDKAKKLIEHIEGWTKIEGFDKMLQAAYRVNKLEKMDIPTIVINNRDEEYNITEVELFVENKNRENAIKAIKVFEGWRLADSFTNPVKAELNLDLLEQNNIDVIVFKKKDSTGNIETIDLYTSDEDSDDAKSLIDQNKKWMKVKTFQKMYNADLYKEILDENEIPSVIISERDSMFLLGDIHLYVEDEYFEKANGLIADFEKHNQDIIIDEPDIEE